jgi:hypothetical protein
MVHYRILERYDRTNDTWFAFGIAYECPETNEVLLYVPMCSVSRRLAFGLVSNLDASHFPSPSFTYQWSQVQVRAAFEPQRTLIDYAHLPLDNGRNKKPSQEPHLTRLWAALNNLETGIRQTLQQRLIAPASITVPGNNLINQNQISQALKYYNSYQNPMPVIKENLIYVIKYFHQYDQFSYADVVLHPWLIPGGTIRGLSLYYHECVELSWYFTNYEKQRLNPFNSAQQPLGYNYAHAIALIIEHEFLRQDAYIRTNNWFTIAELIKYSTSSSFPIWSNSGITNMKNISAVPHFLNDIPGKFDLKMVLYILNEEDRLIRPGFSQKVREYYYNMGFHMWFKMRSGL